MIKPTIIFEPHVPSALQFYTLIKDAEYSFYKVYDHITTNRCCTEFDPNFIPPVIFLSNKIIRSNKKYFPRDLENIDRHYDDNRDFNRYPEGVIINTILLQQYIAESHTVILYYEAIKEYANNNHLDYQETYEYALASAMFEALHQECFPCAFIFQKHKHPISDKCEVLTCALSEYYAYCYCNDAGYSRVTDHLLDTWYKYFYTTYPYAQALYFTFSRYSHISYSDSIAKHYKVFSLTNGPYQRSIDDALNEMYYA